MKIAQSFLLISVLTISISIAQTTLSNYQKALSILDKSLSATAKDAPNSILLTAKGTIRNMGHYEAPEKTKDIIVEETYAYFQQEQVAFLRSAIQNNGNSYIRSSISKADSMYHIGYYDRGVISRNNTQNYSFESAKMLPIKLLQLAYKNRQSLRYLGSDQMHEWLSFSHKLNDAITLYINKKTNLLDKIESLGYSDRYGDVAFVSEYKNYQNLSGIQIPQSRVDYEYGMIERELVYGDVRFDAKPDTIDLRVRWTPSNFKNKLAEIIPKSEDLTFENIAPNIDLIKINTQNNKVLAVQFKTYLSLFESPSGIALNQQILSEIQSRYPTKPLRYVFLTHHHPDHAGGMRSFANLPVTFVSTQGNEAYFKKLLSTSHTLGKAKTANGNKTKFDFVALDGQKNYKDEQMEVVAYEIGKNTTHTNEHLAFYFPQSKILWSGDLLFFRVDGKIYPAGERGKSVYGLIQNQKLAIDKIYTSWPLHGQTAFGTVEELKKAVEMK